MKVLIQHKVKFDKLLFKFYLKLFFVKFLRIFVKINRKFLRNRNKSSLKMLKKQSYSNPVLFTNMGNIYSKMYNFNMARYCYIRALKLSPDSDIYNSNLGCSLYYNNEHEMAKKALDKASEINPANIKNWLNRSFVEYSEGNYDSALFYCNKAIAINSSCSKAYFNRGMINLKNCKYALALDDFRKCIKLNIFYFRAYKRKNEAKRALREIKS